MPVWVQAQSGGGDQTFCRPIIYWPEFKAGFLGVTWGGRLLFSIGEFDSGSERTLAAWIRHASRTRFSRLAITEKIEWRMGA